ncbi:MAG TPA: hydrogenase nickel incorporation protein HypB [Deltaproteobacteria bacterium]|nr:hydrogenase nickel incorporation protein HypB [Deltaproteobacteria bacterium]
MSEIRVIEVKEEILGDNRREADGLRESLRAGGTFLLNLMSSPGAGKTTLIARTIESLGQRYRIGVLEADIESTVDAERISALGVPAVQIRTGGFCHVDAFMVKNALDAIGASALDIVIIENVGNLVCPAEFDTGAHMNAMILSVPEGDDKPLKYPLMFTVCDALVVNKTDYLGMSDFDMPAFRQRVLKLNRGMAIFELSAKTGRGLDAWTGWLDGAVSSFLGRPAG